jgi:xylan 1,4-beta-xylosidase
VLSTTGIPLPVLNVFRMFGMMGGKRVAVASSSQIGLDAIRREGVRGQPDVGGLASLQDDKLSVLAWHFHDDDVPGPAAEVELSLDHLPDRPGPFSLRHFRIDQDHSNAFEAWKRMSSPARPTPEQYADLEHASQLALLSAPERVRPEGGRLTLRFSLPRQAVSLLVLDGAQ